MALLGVRILGAELCLVWELKATIKPTPFPGPTGESDGEFGCHEGSPLLLLGVTLKHGADLLAAGALTLGPTQSNWRAGGLLHAPTAWGSCLVKEWEGMS